MTQAIRRAGLRIALVFLAVGMVVVAAIILTPRFDPKQDVAAEMARLPKHLPTPGSEAALHQAIAEAESGVPNYDRARKARSRLPANLSLIQRVSVALEGGITVPTDQDLLAAAHQQQQVLSRLGPLQSATYKGGTGRFDLYRVTYRNESLEWFISVGPNGALSDYGFDPEGLPGPQDYIDNYARFPLRQRLFRFATQFGILLIAAAFGRLALRLRL